MTAQGMFIEYGDWIMSSNDYVSIGKVCLIYAYKFIRNWGLGMTW